MALAAEHSTPQRIEVYVEAFNDLLPANSVPLDLVMEEIQLRKERGETPSRDEYANRFPRFESMFVDLADAKEVTSAVKKLGRPPDLETGGQIDDFLIVQKLGQGAFAHVYLARQLSMHRLVALKVSRGKDDEPQALAQFDHPNIVRVYDQRHVTDQQVHLLYMQFHPGGTLSEVVKAVRNSKADRRGLVLLETIDRNLLHAAQIAPDRSSVRQWLMTAEWPTVVAWGEKRSVEDRSARGGDPVRGAAAPGRPPRTPLPNRLRICYQIEAGFPQQVHSESRVLRDRRRME